MRLKRTNVIFALCLVIWASLLYYTLYTTVQISASDKNGKNDVVNNNVKLNQLEDGISETFKSNNQMIQAVHKYLSGKVSKSEDNSEKIPVLVFACNRVSVTKCLDKLLSYRPDVDTFPVIVSQDCNHAETTKIIESYSQVKLIQQPDQSDIQVPPKEKKFKGYFKIARHYGWALNQIFFNFNYTKVIIVEDDLEVSPDFFEYFLGTHRLLELDPSLWCVSAWNDNGKESLVDLTRPELLYRTDFFPGLGWMLTRKIWMELHSKWPKAYWDDWIRDPAQRKGRSCIRPGISRTRTFGKVGVSNGLFYEKHLKYIKLNEQFVPFTKMNVSYLLKDNYDSNFVKDVYRSAIVTYQELREDNVQSDVGIPVRIMYRTRDEFKRRSKMLGLMDDFKSGVPRTAYKGIVTFHFKGRMVHLAPNLNWNGYDPSWS